MNNIMEDRMGKVSFKSGDITYKYLNNKSKHDLCMDYLSLLATCKKLQKAEHNSKYKPATPQSFDKESYMNWCIASGIPANMAEGIFNRFIK